MIMNTYVYYSEEEEIYNSKYKCHFNKKLAEWAISKMEMENSSGDIVPLKKKTIDEYDEFLKENKVNIQDESYYDGYYLWHMAMADYPESLEDDKHRAKFVEETINDPDGCPTSVLACFVAKMDKMGIPIYWERFF